MSVKRVEIKLRLNSFHQFICILHKNQNKHFTQGWHSKPAQKNPPNRTWPQVGIFYF